MYPLPPRLQQTLTPTLHAPAPCSHVTFRKRRPLDRSLYDDSKTDRGQYGEVAQTETISLRFDLERGQDPTHRGVTLLAGRIGAQPKLDSLRQFGCVVHGLHELLLLVE